MRCSECGSEGADSTQPCIRCGAPVVGPDPLTAEFPNGQAAAQYRNRQRKRVLTIVGLLVIAAVVTISLIATLDSGAPASAPSTGQLTVDQLRAGDCLPGSNLGLGTSAGWPDVVTAVRCSHRHTAEIVFAWSAWPPSLTFPGVSVLRRQAESRCTSAFGGYVRQQYSSTFGWDYVTPDEPTWDSGTPAARWLVCIAYDPTADYPGGLPVDYSIRQRPPAAGPAAAQAEREP